MIEIPHKLVKYRTRLIVNEVKLQTGHPAKLKDWKIVVNVSTSNVFIVVTIQAYDGLRQRSTVLF
jgi:hypothetical protein